MQHFTGTLDNWDPAVCDPLAAGREVILFENGGGGPLHGTCLRNDRRNGAARAHVVERLMRRAQDREPVAGADVAKAQIASFRDWERVQGERFADLKSIHQATLVRLPSVDAESAAY